MNNNLTTEPQRKADEGRYIQTSPWITIFRATKLGPKHIGHTYSRSPNTYRRQLKTLPSATGITQILIDAHTTHGLRV